MNFLEFSIVTGDRPEEVIVKDMLEEGKESILDEMQCIHGKDNWDQYTPWATIKSDHCNKIKKNRVYAQVVIVENKHSEHMIEKSKYVELKFENREGYVSIFGKVIDSYVGDPDLDCPPDLIIEEMTESEVTRILKRKKAVK